MNPEPENKPTLDRTTLLPILLGVFSLFGIVLVFMIGRFNANRPAVPTENTPTPFKYQLIGTEPGISTAELTAEEPGFDVTSEPSFGNTVEPLGNETKPPSLGLVVTAQQGGSSGSGSSSNNNNNNNGSSSPTKTKTSSSAVQTTAAGSGTDPVIILNPGTKTATQAFGIVVRTFTPSRTPGPTITLTPSRTKFITSTTGSSFTATASRTPTVTATGATKTPQVPLGPSSLEYDDSHPLILYNGWNAVADTTAFQSTLHVSNTVGSTVTFRFTGQQIRLKFQEGTSFGVIRITIGGLNFDLDESNGTNEWVSVLLAHGTYTVTITHTGGGSVNLDSIFIPDLNTPTPTATPSATSNGL